MERVKIDPMRQNTIDHYAWISHRMPQYSPTRMAELAPGVVAVEDSSGECDTLFDVERWRYTRPDLWGGTSSEVLINSGMGVLEGVGRIPPVSSIEDMARFSRVHLTPKGQAIWHETIQYFWTYERTIS